MVESLWRYLLKSAQGESLDSLGFGADGPDDDRSWGCLDADGVVVSAKHPRRWGRLLQVEAWAAGDDTLVRVPGGPASVAGTADADDQLSRWLGAQVRLSRTVPSGARLHRLFPRTPGLRPSWAEDEPEDTVSPMAGRRRFVDFGAVHVVTVEDLEAVGADDARRFRPNVVLALPALQPGQHVTFAGGVRLRVTMPTPRCAVPGLEQHGLAPAPELLRAVGRRRTTLPGLGSAACVGVYADVVTGGTVTLGEQARVA